MTAVFDLEANAIHMQQYTNCGSTPAAIASAADLTTLEGKCSTPRTMVPGTGSASEPSPTSSSSPASGTGSSSGGTEPATTEIPAASGGKTGGSTTSAAGLRRCSPAALAVAMVVLLALN